MADDHDPETSKPTAPRLVRSKDFRVAFANTFRLRAGVQEASITFGYQTELPASAPDLPAQNILQDEVEIVLTPTALKILCKALGDYVEAIEAELALQFLSHSKSST